MGWGSGATPFGLSVMFVTRMWMNTELINMIKGGGMHVAANYTEKKSQIKCKK